MNIHEKREAGQSPAASTGLSTQLDYAISILGERHVKHCLEQGISYVVRMYQGAWFANQTLEPLNCTRAYREILDYLRAAESCQS